MTDAVESPMESRALAAGPMDDEDDVPLSNAASVPTPTMREPSLPPHVHTPRRYQMKLLEMAKQRNTIAILETGSGKTLIAVKLLEHIALAQRSQATVSTMACRLDFFPDPPDPPDPPDLPDLPDLPLPSTLK